MVQIIILPAPDDQRVELTFPFDRTILATVRQLPGSRWDRGRRRWSIPRRALPALSARLSGMDVKVVERRTLQRIRYGSAVRTARRVPRMPRALGSNELQRLIDSLHNLKHRALALVLYSAGLRVSQAVRLRIEDVDIDRMLLHVRKGNDRRSRCLPLAQPVAHELRRYMALYRPREWLFPGAVANRPLSTHSVRSLMGAALHRAGIGDSNEPVNGD